MKDLIKKALLEAGVTEWTMETQAVHTAELFFIKHDLDMRRMKDTCKYFVNVFKDTEADGKALKGQSKFIAVPGMSYDEILDAVKSAFFAAALAANPTWKLPDACKDEHIPAKGKLAEMAAEDAAMEMAEAAFSADVQEKGFINTLEIFVEKTMVAFESSAGSDVSYDICRIEGEFVAQCKEPEDVEMFHQFAYDDIQTEALKAKVEDALKVVTDRAVAAKALPTGTYDVILSGEQMYTMMGYFLERGNAAMVFPGYSTWKIGSKVQDDGDGEKLNITLRAQAPYSSEGLPMKDMEFIENGTLKAYHGGVRLSYYMGVEPRGNFDSLTLDAGSTSFEEMKQKPYLYPVCFSDFQMDSFSGYFGGEIRLAYLFDGEKIKVVTGGSINGTLADCSGRMVFSKERYDTLRYKGPFAVRIPGVNVAGNCE